MTTSPSPLTRALAAQAPLVVVETTEPAEMYPAWQRDFADFLRAANISARSARLGLWDPLAGSHSPDDSLLAPFGDAGSGVQDDALAWMRRVAANLTDPAAIPTLWVLLHPKVLWRSPQVAFALERLAAYIQNEYAGPSRLMLAGVIGDLPPMLQPLAVYVPAARPTADDLAKMLREAFTAVLGNPQDLPPQVREQTGVERIFDAVPRMARIIQGLGWRQAVNAIKAAASQARSPQDAVSALVEAKIQAVKTIAPFASVTMPPKSPPPLVGIGVLARELDLLRATLASGGKASSGTGMLLMGPPGTGKSSFVGYASHKLQLPVFRLNMGELFNSLLGESQNRLRRFIEMVNAAGPCIVHVDEIEKQTPSLRGMGSDGGTGAQMLSILLEWMQEAADKRLPIVFIATANTVALDNLPPELVSRFPQRYVTTYPNKNTLAGIFAAHLARAGAEGMDVDALAEHLVRASQGGVKPVGRDVAQVVDRAVKIAYAQHPDHSAPAQEDVHEAIRQLREGTIQVGQSGIYAIPLGEHPSRSHNGASRERQPFAGLRGFLTEEV